MELSNEFTVSAPIDEAFAVLTDIERIAPCLPGAQLTEVEGEEYRGTVKIKVGPITASFKGTASLVERDEAAHRAVLKAQGRDTGGKGNANATITAQLEPAGDGTHVKIDTDLNITGRVAQFGRGALADVSQKLIGQFADSLESDVLAGDGSSAPAAAATAPPAAAPEPAPTSAPTAAQVASEPASAEAAPAPDAPVVRKISAPEAAPVDLLDTAGAPLAKRLVPALLAALGLFVLLRRRKRRRRS
ncbi:MAG: SRPBCC family protein [Acidimicrobiia bacterium]|nr:SRPBCC family protein [Acidimicrobiia bacterium]